MSEETQCLNTLTFTTTLLMLEKFFQKNRKKGRISFKGKRSNY